MEPVSESEKQSNDEMTQNSRVTARKKYNVISEEVRKTIIHQIVDKKRNIKEVARIHDLKLSTCKAIVQVYQREGRIGKKSTRDRKSKIVNTVLVRRIDPMNPSQTTLTPFVFITEAKTASKKGDDSANIELIQEAFRNAQEHLKSVISNNYKSIFLGSDNQVQSNESQSKQIEEAFIEAQKEALATLMQQEDTETSNKPGKQTLHQEMPIHNNIKIITPNQEGTEKSSNANYQPTQLVKESTKQPMNNVSNNNTPLPISPSQNIKSESITRIEQDFIIEDKQIPSNSLIPKSPLPTGQMPADFQAQTLPFFNSIETDSFAGTNAGFFNHYSQSPSISTMNASPAATATITPFLNPYTLNSPQFPGGSGIGASSFLSPLNLSMNGNFSRIPAFQLNQNSQDEVLGYLGAGEQYNYNQPIVQSNRSLFSKMISETRARSQTDESMQLSPIDVQQSKKYLNY